MHNQDTCVYMATGSGKSLCFQLPAVVSGKVVIVASTSDNCMTAWWLDTIKWQRWGNNFLIDFSLLRFWTIQRVDLQNFKFQAGQPSHLPDEGAGFKVQRNRGETRCGVASSNGGSFSGRPWSTGFFPWVSSKSETFFVCLWGRNAVVYFSPGYIKVWSLVNRAGWYLTVGCIVPTQLQAGLKLKACFLGSGWSLSWCQGRMFVWLNLFSSPIGWRERERERLESCYVSRQAPSNCGKSLKNIEAVGPLKTGSQWWVDVIEAEVMKIEKGDRMSIKLQCQELLKLLYPCPLLEGLHDMTVEESTTWSMSPLRSWFNTVGCSIASGLPCSNPVFEYFDHWYIQLMAPCKEFYIL